LSEARTAGSPNLEMQSPTVQISSSIRRPEREKKKNDREEEEESEREREMVEKKKKNLRWKCQVRV
jgi:hypothetical protein